MPTKSSRRSTKSVVCDAGVLYAAADRADADHADCARLLQSSRGPVYVPALVVAEVEYLLQRRLGPRSEATFLATLAEGQLIVESPTQRDLLRMAELVWRYQDFPLGSVDASIVALAERLGVTTIATLDHRHFSVVRPSHVEAFDLVP